MHQLQAGAVYAKENAICSQCEDDSSSEDSVCLQVKVKCTQANLQRIFRPTHLITNLAYRLKAHHKKLISKSKSRHLLAPSSLEIRTYTTDTVRIVGSCMFYLVHLDTKKLMDVTFFVAVYDGSILLSCKTTLMLGFIQPRTRLDYLPPQS